MASLIDFTKPIYGTPTTQSVRDNFQTAQQEITDLQDTRTPDWPYLPKAGGIMTGKITLDADPVSNLHAATKQYVDNLAFGASGTIPEAAKDGWYYARGGAPTPAGNNLWSNNPSFTAIKIGISATTPLFGLATDATYNYHSFNADNSDSFRYHRISKLMSLIFAGNSIVDFTTTSINFLQPVTVAANPTAPLGVATKQYVDTAVTAGAATIVVSDTAPVAPSANALWWDSVGTQLYLWYNDGNSSQWVNATNAGLGAGSIPVASSTLPLMNGAAAIGVGTTWARNDHVHPVDTSRLSITGGNISGTLNVGGIASNILAGTFYVGNLGSAATWALGTYLDAAGANWIHSNSTYCAVTLSADANNFRISIGPPGTAGSVASGFITGLSIDRPGNLVAAGNITGVNITASNTVNSPRFQVTGGAFANYPGLYWSGAAAIMAYNNAYYWTWSSGTGDLAWYMATGTIQFRASDASIIMSTASAYKPGGGPWLDSSDIRIKRDVEDYRAGLQEILGLRPITYYYNGLGGMQDDGIKYHGLVAQEAQINMPEMVISRTTKLKEDDAEEIELLQLNTAPLIYALVNAVRELSARIETLEKA